MPWQQHGEQLFNILLRLDCKFAWFVFMRVDLKIKPPLQGFVYQVDAGKNPPLLGSHQHDELEINLLVRGQLTYLVDGRRWTVPRRSLVWFPPNQEHQLLHRTADALYFVAVFTPNLFLHVAQTTRYQHLHHPTGPGLASQAIAPEPFEFLRRFLANLMEGGPDAALLNRELGFGYRSGFAYDHQDSYRLNAGLHFLLITCWNHLQHSTTATAPAVHPAIQRAIALLDDHTEDLQLERLATDCGLSMTYLSRLFHRQVGMPLHAYRASRRLLRFWDLWSHTKSPRLLDTALAAGFGSYAQFHRVFQAAHGCGPRTYFHTESCRIGGQEAHHQMRSSEQDLGGTATPSS